MITTLTVCVWFAVGHESHDRSVRMALRPSAAAAHLQRVQLLMRTHRIYLDGPGAGAATWFCRAPPELYPPFLPPAATTTLTKRRLYSIFLKARPRGFFFFSAFSALGVCGQGN